MTPLKRILFLSLFFTSVYSYSQYSGNYHTYKIVVQSDTIQLDTLSVIPGSLKIYSSNNTLIDSNAYHISYSEAKLIIKHPQWTAYSNDSITVDYKTFPYFFSSETKHKDVNRIHSDIQGKKDLFSYTFENKNEDLFKMDGLNKTGSISRGITFGNSQDVAVNSNLNLQLSGHLTNNIDLLLAATDNNVPIQADGTTQQLQEFDKVFIQFSNPSSKLIAGDFQLFRPSGYFMNFHKKSQGINFSTIQKIKPIATKDSSKPAIYSTSISAAVSRGKFSRNLIQGIESNQGPYRLVGAEKELFIIVLSGTEKVYIDGKLLTRGQENDYIIDYNTAEITFTAKQLITKDKRIVIEFQYSDKNYARSLVQFSNDYEQERLKAHLHIYSEQDNKSQPLQQTLNDEQKALLYRIGDTLSKAITPGIDSIAWNFNEVLYKKTDTTIGSKKYSPVYIYSTDSSKAHYRLTFSNVGQGNGNYNQVSSNANGKVFQWIMPDTITGNARGSYEPVIQLITPKKKQMITAGIDYAIRKNTTLSIEAALSNNDLNTFSNIDNQDNTGYGIKLNFSDASPLLSKKESKDSSINFLILQSNINYEYIQKKFSPIERYRSVEFERDWNRSTTTVLSDQHILGAGIDLSKRNTGAIGYHFNTFIEGNNYNATKHYATININRKNTAVLYNGSILNSQSVNNSTFYRHKSEITQKIKAFQIGVRDEFEQNKFSLSSSEKDTTLLLRSYRFWEWQGFIQNADTTKNKYGMNYKQRTDFASGAAINFTTLHKSAIAESYGAFYEWLQQTNNQFKLYAAYRKLNIVDSTLTLQKPDNSIVGRAEYNLRILQGFIYSNTYYEIGSGMEIKKEYTFIQVPAGQGIYTWVDYNKNEIKELNEFEIARYTDQATYIKVYTPTNNYIRTYSNQFSQTLMLKPAALWEQKKGVLKFLSYFANQTSYRVERKSTEADFKKAYNPFLTATNAASLVSLTSAFRNTLFINQMNPVFGVDLNYQAIQSKTLLINGIDQQANIFKQLQLRWNMTQKISINTDCKSGNKNSSSQFFNTRDYSINYFEAEPKLSYQPNTTFRISLSYKYTDKKNGLFTNKDSLNTIRGGETAFLNDVGLETKYNVLDKGSLSLKVNYVTIKFHGIENSSTGFEMLDGLKSGKNIIWGLSYQRTLANNLQLSFTYDGRKTASNKIIHTGGAQIRAYF